jgi:hypothetical protein
MKDALVQAIETLGKEAQTLIQERERLYGIVQEIEVRLHQISGAIAEMDKLLKTESTDINQ